MPPSFSQLPLGLILGFVVKDEISETKPPNPRRPYRHRIILRDCPENSLCKFIRVCKTFKILLALPPAPASNGPDCIGWAGDASPP